MSEFGNDLPLTEISTTGNAAFGIVVTSSGNALPAAVLVGTGGRTPPTEIIDSDGLTIFNPDIDGADFWESLEGMLVEIDRPQVVANSDALGETYVVASLGEGATGMNGSGGITISPGDYQSRDDPARRRADPAVGLCRGPQRRRPDRRPSSASSTTASPITSCC